jgi:hypothetical protein
MHHLIAARAQDADAVRLHGDAGPDGVPRWAVLNELGRETVLAQGCGQGKAGDSSTDDQDSFNVSHLVLLSRPIRSLTLPQRLIPGEAVKCYR